ncbi:MAG: YdiY family protein [Phycisphaerae bacterium]
MRNLICAIIILVLSPLLYADVIYLSNGDRLTGDIKTMINGSMVLDSALAGEITIALENVSSFETEAPIELHLADGSKLNQPVSKSSDGSIETKETDLLKAQKVSISSISAVNPPAPEVPRWKGDIVGGVTVSNGNTEKKTYNFSAKASKRTEFDRLSLSADLGKSEEQEDTTENWWKTKAKYDYFLSKKLYSYLDGRYETDKIANLERRILIGGGFGYQWIESDEMNFNSDLGVASRYEKFENDPDASSEFSGQLGYYFDCRLSKNLNFVNELTLYPSFENISDEYYVSTYAQLKYQLNESMFMSFKTILDYDKSPAPSTEASDTKYIFGVGMSF